MYQLELKILLVGDKNAGKTEIVETYVDNRSNNIHLTTIGSEHKDKVITIDNYEIKLMIWDTSGQERYRSINRNFIRNTDGIIFVYNITDLSSFENIKIWIRNMKERDINFKCVLCGNKADLEQGKGRRILIEELEFYGKEENLPVLEISSKTGYNLKEAFNKLVHMIMANKTEEELIRQYGLNNYAENLKLYQEKKEKEQKSLQKEKEKEEMNIVIKVNKLDKLNKYTKY